jgi:predicted alpha/beta superfamily hydrolase
MIRSVILLFCLAFTAPSLFAQKGRPKAADTTRVFALGPIEEIYSRALSEKRTLNIYLPEGYKASDTTRYPVVYLLDGSADEDFIHVVGLYQFNAFPWIDRVPKSIVVGIANVDRRRDFTYPTTIATDKKRYPTTGGSAAFITFLQNELQPYIETRFRTDSSKTIIGQSLGGLLATEILLKKPDLFNRYIIISPSLWWDDGSLLTAPSDIYSKTFNRPPVSISVAGRKACGPVRRM